MLKEIKKKTTDSSEPKQVTFIALLGVSAKIGGNMPL